MAGVNVPLLIIAFNRPTVLKRLLESLAQHRFKQLFVFVDHERVGVPGEAELVEECRELVRSIDFCDEKSTNFATTNLGCGYGPFSAITWAFGNSKELIVLEDDCIPASSFFPFCAQLLARYRDDQKVWMISGNNFSEKNFDVPESYTFSGYAHFWGWATWKRSWQQVKYDREICLKELDRIPENRFLSEQEREFFITDYRANLLRKSDDLWDYQAALAMALNDGLSIVPQKNLVSNIGLHGTHFSSDKPFFKLASDPEFSVVTHPKTIERDRLYDRIHFEKHWQEINTRSLAEKLRTRWIKIRKFFSDWVRDPKNNE